MSKEKAASLVDRAHEYLEGFGLGYKRDDPSTHRDECLPVINEKVRHVDLGVCAKHLTTSDIGHDGTHTHGHVLVQETTDTRGNKQMHYCCSHEDWVWEVRKDKNVRAAWEKVYGTEDLIVSFDAINITMPHRKRPNNRWAHQDQDPEAGGFRQVIFCSHSFCACLSDH